MNPNSRSRIDYTNKDYASLRAGLLELAREKLPEWTDHSPNDLGVVLLELFATMGDILLYYQDRIANESYLETAVERQSVINLLRLIGYELRPPQPASADLTLLFEDVKDEETPTKVRIPTDAEFETTKEATGEPVRFRYVREALEFTLQDLPTRHDWDDQVYRSFETLPVVQVDAVETDETLGSSDGSAGQRFPLARTPLIGGSLRVRVDEGAEAEELEEWERRETLLYSLSDSPHYVVRCDEDGIAWIEFGDGKYGKIPPRGRNNVTAAYRVGGGEKGNVPPHTITKAVTAIARLEHVFNERPAACGADAELSSEAVKRGPHLFRAMRRAVTARDYEAFARQFGVGKARARAAGWNCLELYVAPVGGGYPTDTLKEDLRAYLEDKRMLTCIIEVQEPVYVNVCIEGTLQIEPHLFAKQVQQRVENAVRQLLAFENVDFGDRLYLSKIYEAIEAIEGVAWVDVTRFAEKNSSAAIPQGGKLSFDWHEIPQTGPLAWEWDQAEGAWRWWTTC
jgi:hypothetical protein